MTILVIGGTGTVGSETVRQLLARGAKPRVLIRDAEKLATLPAGATGVLGDLELPGRLVTAVMGVEAMLLITPLSETETDEGLAAVEAAKNAGVKRVVYMTVHRLADGFHIPHFQSKMPVIDAIRRSGVAYTLIEPNNFYQNDLWFIEAIARHGVYPQPLGEIGLNRVDIRDIAEAAANALLQPGHQGKSYPLVGPDALTGAATAEIYARRLGREVRYVGDDLASFETALRQMMPGWLADDLMIMYRFFLEKGLKASGEDLDRCRQILGHEPRRFEDFVTDTFLPAAKAVAGAGG